MSHRQTIHCAIVDRRHSSNSTDSCSNVSRTVVDLSSFCHWVHLESVKLLLIVMETIAVDFVAAETFAALAQALVPVIDVVVALHLVE